MSKRLFLFFFLFWILKTGLPAKEIAWKQAQTVCQRPTHLQKKTLTALADLLHLSATKENCKALLAQAKTLPADSKAHELIRRLLSEKPALLLAKTWQEGMAVTNWWMSEKLDGVRAYWNGQELVSRGGNRLEAPLWFTQSLPNIKLDGELWMGRGQFEQTISTVRSHEASEAWKNVRYFVFDAPEILGDFEARWAHLQEVIPPLNAAHVQLVEHQKIKNPAEFQAAFQKVIAQKGEGLMLRKPGSFYEGKRSDTLLKVKPHQDMEGEVLGHLPGKGKFQGKMGALLVELADGTSLKIGTGFTHEQRENPPAIGEKVVFKHYGFTQKGKPRFPVYLRLHQAP